MDANAIGIALVMTVLGAGDHHARRRDAIVEALEPLRFLVHGRFEGIGMFDVLEHDLEGYLHWEDLMRRMADQGRNDR
jgi:hypothetical protein